MMIFIRRIIRLGIQYDEGQSAESHLKGRVGRSNGGDVYAENEIVQNNLGVLFE